MVMAMEKIRVLMFGHGGCDNHGCEAIIRTTSQMIADRFKNKEIKVASHEYEKDSKLNLPHIDRYVPHNSEIIRYTWPWIRYLYYNRVTRDYEASYEISQQDVIREAADSDICLSVGGDNYCYGEPVHLYALDRSIKRMGKKLVLWGASIEPDGISERMKNDLRQFDAIFVRESITYRELKRLKLNNNVFLYPDPAFMMEKEAVPMPRGWKDGKMIGMNLSPLIMKYEGKKGLAFMSFSRLIEKIFHTTDFNIALIPHVLSEDSSDYDVLKLLYDKYKDSGRLILVGTGYTAPQYKGLIAKCRMFVGSRTHSTIAAYSTCVPTLVLGYSVKARGIARDIFGAEQNHVLPVQDLNRPEQLDKAFDCLLKNEKSIREHLKEMIPSYIKKAGDAAGILEQVCLEKR